MHCSRCAKPHDLDDGPDEGLCLFCGGALVEQDGENPNSFAEAVVEAVNDGIAKIHLVRKKAKRGEN